MRNLASPRATLSRPLPPAPTRGRQSLRGLVPHCRRSQSNGGARTSGHLGGARDGASREVRHKRIQALAALSSARTRSEAFFRQGECPPSPPPPRSRRSPRRAFSLSLSFLLGWPGDLKVSARGSGTRPARRSRRDLSRGAERSRGDIMPRANAPLTSREGGQT